MARKKVTCYMDAVDWDHELGEAAGGTKLYASLEDMINENGCTESCGAVKVEVVKIEQVLPTTLKGGRTFAEWEEYEKSQQYLDHLAEKIKQYSNIAKLYQGMLLQARKQHSELEHKRRDKLRRDRS